MYALQCDGRRRTTRIDVLDYSHNVALVFRVRAAGAEQVQTQFGDPVDLPVQRRMLLQRRIDYSLTINIFFTVLTHQVL